MDRESFSQFGWLVVAVITLVTILFLATPLGSFLIDQMSALPDNIGEGMGLCDHSETDTIDTWIRYSDTQHRKTSRTTCTKCGKILRDELKEEFADHTYDSNYVCTVCGYRHSHVYSTLVSETRVPIPVNSTQHKVITVRRCNCGLTNTTELLENHTYEGETCTQCGYTKETTSYTVKYDGNGNGNTVVNVPENQKKIKDQILVLSSVTPGRDGYTFTGWNTASNGNGIEYGAGDEYKDNAPVTLYAQWSIGHAHVYDQEIATVEHVESTATCISKARYYYSCACGQNGTETFEYGDYGNHTWDLVGHTGQADWQGDFTSPVDFDPMDPFTVCEFLSNLLNMDPDSFETPDSVPICPECGNSYMSGATIYLKNHTVCINCGVQNAVVVVQWYCNGEHNDGPAEDTTHDFVQEIVYAHSHIWDSGVVTKQPTCTVAGVKTYSCTVEGCEATFTESINALGHNFVFNYEDGCDTYYKCNRPGCTATKKTTSHTWGDYVVTKEATGCVGTGVSRAGIQSRQCTVCGATTGADYFYLEHLAGGQEDYKYGTTFERWDSTYHRVVVGCVYCHNDMYELTEHKFNRTEQHNSSIKDVGTNICPSCGRKTIPVRDESCYDCGEVFSTWTLPCTYAGCPSQRRS